MATPYDTGYLTGVRKSWPKLYKYEGRYEMKLQKLKATWIAAMVAMATLMTTVPVYAAEVSAESTQIKQNEEKSTVFVFGASIAMAYDDGTIEIIPNNPSGRVDVMIGGKLYKGMGKVIVSARKEKEIPNMVLEKNSFFVKGVTEQTASAVSEKAKQAILANSTVSSLSDIKGLETSGILYLNNEGNLETPDGKTVAADKAGVSLTTVEQAYSAHKEAQEAALAKEREEAASAGEWEEATVIVDGNLSIKEPEATVTADGQCRHLHTYNYDKWQPVAGGTEFDEEGRPIYTFVTKWSFCVDCFKRIWNEEDEFTHVHKYDYEQTPESVETNTYDGTVTNCNVILLGKCKCYYHGPFDMSTGRVYLHNEHNNLGDGEYCPYCHYDKYGNPESGNTSSETSQADSENTTPEPDGE